MTEQQLQAACVKWLWNEHPETRGLFFAVNNNSEHVARAMNRKAVGMVAGVSDTILLWLGAAYLIEFKTETGKQSLKQKQWQKTVESHDFYYLVVRSEGQFRELVGNIL